MQRNYKVLRYGFVKIIGMLMAAMLTVAFIGCGEEQGTGNLSNADVEGTEDSFRTESNGNRLEQGAAEEAEQESEQELKQEPEEKSTQEAYVPTIIAIYEAEDADTTGNVRKASGTSGGAYSGEGYLEGFEDDEDACVFTVEIADDGFYDLNFISMGIGGDKHNYVDVNDERVGTVMVGSGEFADSVLDRVYLEAGTYSIRYSKYWGWVYLDNLTITVSRPIDPAIYEVSARQVNENASESAKRLMSYLCDIYGTNFLSGQNCDAGMFGKEFQVIKTAVGKTPAVLGLDLMDYTPSRVERGTKGYATQHAINFWEAGGIVTLCWHWNAPAKYLTGTWYRGFYTEHTNINLAAIMNGDDEEGYDLILADIDAIAQELLLMQEADVPILFRPLHEASNGWFWWGDSGGEAYKKLYILLYEKLTYDYKLNNLIWVWNGQSKDWYPGDEYVDLVGEDIYPGERVYTSQIAKYLEVVSFADSIKPVYLTENGCLFDPDLAIRDGAMWGMWCTWGGEFVSKDTAIFTLSEQYTEKEMLEKAYHHERVVTLESLPDLKNYPIRDE